MAAFRSVLVRFSVGPASSSRNGDAGKNLHSLLLHERWQLRFPGDTIDE